jgi:hypothetical protein
MNPAQATVRGTLQPDGTLRLDEPPDLPPGRVVVTLQALGEPSGEPASRPIGAGTHRDRLRGFAAA